MSDPGRRVLVVDDDERVRTAVTWALQADGFVVEHAPDGVTALARVEADPPLLVVLDLSLPGLGGLDVLRRIRAAEAAMAAGPAGAAPGAVGANAVPGADPLPVIILSGRDGETDRIVGLDLGADDYLVKPFSPGELAARARSVLRRVRPRAEPGTFVPEGAGGDPTGGVRLDAARREVSVDGRPVDLTAKEFDLLAHFVTHPRHVFSRAQLLGHVWASNGGWQSEATVTEHVHRLRQKIEKESTTPRRLRTVRGVGYRWEP